MLLLLARYPDECGVSEFPESCCSTGWTEPSCFVRSKQTADLLSQHLHSDLHFVLAKPSTKVPVHAASRTLVSVTEDLQVRAKPLQVKSVATNHRTSSPFKSTTASFVRRYDFVAPERETRFSIDWHWCFLDCCQALPVVAGISFWPHHRVCKNTRPPPNIILQPFHGQHRRLQLLQILLRHPRPSPIYPPTPPPANHHGRIHLSTVARAAESALERIFSIQWTTHHLPRHPMGRTQRLHLDCHLATMTSSSSRLIRLAVALYTCPR